MPSPAVPRPNGRLAPYVNLSRRPSLGLAVRTALGATVASLLLAQANALTINPIWDSSITSDPNAAQIESIINGVLANYDTAFAGTNLTLDVNILESSSIGGANNSPNTFSTTYTAYRGALQSHATTLDDVAVVAGLGPANPVNTSSLVTLSRANAAALGFSVTTNGDGSVTTGTIRLGLTSGGSVSTSFIQQAFAHELDEELGTISGAGGSTPWAIDFTRYSAAGQRSFNSDTTTHAYVSVDGVNMLAEYNQFNHQPGDWGDFALGSIKHIQDYAISGSTVPAVELRMLDSVGYGYTGRSISNAFATNVLNTVTLSTVSTADGVIPNVPSNDVQITEGGGSGMVTLASATTVVNTLTNTATATPVTVNLGGQQLVAGNGAVDAGAGLIEVGSGATALTVGASVNDGTVTAGTSGAYTLGLISANPSAALDIKSAIVNNAGGGVVSVLVLNTGTVITEGTNTYSGTTTIGNGATLQIGNGGTTGTLGSGAVEVDGTLTFYRSNSITIANLLTGAGTVVQAGTGTAVLTGGSSGFSGVFTINSGATLQVGAGGTTGDIGTATITNNGSLVFDRSDTFVLANVMSGSGSLTQAGTGTLSVNITPNITGGTFVQSGILQIGSAALLSGNYSVSGGALLQYSSTTSLAYSGVISGAGSLAKDTTSTILTLSGANTYTGSTTVTAGTLGLNFAGTGAPTSNILAPSSSLVVGNAKVLITGFLGKTLTQSLAGTTFTSSQSNLTLVQNGATSLDVNLGPLTFTPGSSVSFNGATGTTVGARFLTSTGGSNAMLAPGAMYNGTDWAAKDASNTYIVPYTGYTNIYTSTNGSFSVVVPNSTAADVRIIENGSNGTSNSLASANTTINSLLMTASATASTISMSGGALTINGGTAVVGGVAVTTGAKSLTIGSSANDGSITAGASGASTLLLISNNGSTSQSIVVNSLVKDNAGGGAVSLGASGGTGSGTVTLNGTNTFSGNIEITNAGTLQIGGAGSLGSGNYAGNILDAGTLRYSSTAAQTLAGAISGTGGLTKDTGSGTLILTGTNTYTGNTVISAGTLQISGSGVLGGGNYFGVISGAGAFTYNSSATQTLGNNNTFTGNVTVSAGILKFGSSNALGGANTAATKATVTPGATLDIAGFAGSYGVTISGSGSSGQGALINSGTSTLSTSVQTPNITLAANATIGGSGDFYQVATSNGANTLNLAGFLLTKVGTNTFWLDNTTVTGGTVDVSGGKLSQIRTSNMSAATLILENTATAGLSLNNISLSVGSLSGGGTAGGGVALGSGTLTVGALNTSTTYAGVISGTGGLTLNGTGVFTLTGANTYTGSTTISSGTLSFAAGSLDTTGLISMNGGTLQWNGTNMEDISGRIAMAAAKTTTFDTHGNTVTLASDVGFGASGSLVKAGNGALILTAAESYTGTTTVAAGTLQLGSASAVGTLAGGGAVTVNSGATLAFGAGGAATIANALSGSGTLAQTGTGTTTLSGTSAFAGPVSVNAGALLISGSLGDATVTVASGGAFGGTGTVGSSITQNASLVFQAGSMLDYAGGPLTLNGNATFSGSTSIVFSTSPVSGTQYSILDYTGTLTGTANLTSVYRGTVDTTSPGVLKFDAGAISLTWRGTTNANWGTLDGNNNFVRTASPSTVDNFYQGDTVVFDDSSTVKSVTINGALSPTAVVVNSTGTYTFGGSGSIAGPATVTQNGTGTVVMNAANSYTGATTINAGTFKLGNVSALGATSGVTLAAGTTLDLNALTLPSLTLSGAGALGNSSTSTKAYVTSLTLAGNATVSNTSAQKPILLGSITGQNGSLSLGGFTLTKNGTGTLILNGINLTGAGNITINGGTLQIEDDYGTNGSTQEPTTIAGTGSITVNSGASLVTTRWSTTFSMTMPIVLNGGTLGSNWPGPNGATIASPISLAASSSLNFNPGFTYGSVTLSGVISGGASATLTINGDTNVRTLTGVNTYTGNTVLNDGTLTIGGAGVLGAGSYAGAISLASGTTFTYASSSGQILSGVISGAGALTQSSSNVLTLTGNNTYTGATTVNSGALVVSGSIAGSTTTVKGGGVVGTGILGPVTVQSSGNLQPGPIGAPGLLSSGNFSLLSGGYLSLDIGGVAGTGTSSTQYSELNVTGSVSLSGNLQITLFNGYTPNIGDTFYVILNDGSDAISGIFTNAPGGFITASGVEYQVNYAANGNGGSNDVSLTVFAIPEPSAGMLALPALLMLGGFRRNRRRQGFKA